MTDQEKITSARAAFVAAFHSQDIPAMTGFVTENHLIMAPNQQERVGLEAAKEFWETGFSMAITNMEFDPKELVIAGDVAIDRFNWTQHIEMHDSGDTIDDKGNCVWIWRRSKDGGWKLESAIWNSILPQAGTWSGGHQDSK
jgi:ketosteroid isomerase-like protein